MKQTPSELGFFFPAEWAPQESIWLSWPHNGETWPEISKIWPGYFRFVEVISRHQKVCLNMPTRKSLDVFQEKLLAFGVNENNLKMYVHPTNDSWTRDHGPTSLVHRETDERLLLSWGYNAWGGKYPPFDLDNTIPEQISKVTDIDFRIAPMILEGGSIDVNGKGDLLTTKSCLLNPNRNPHLNQEQIEKNLCDYLGVKNILWLEEGIEGDDTDGHIDDISRFVSENQIVSAIETDPSDPNHSILKKNFELLKTYRNVDNKEFEVIEIPMPEKQVVKGLRMPGSYANFLITNKTVIVPVFNSAEDETALRILDDCFPNHQIVDIDASEIIWGLGSFHCLSQQLNQSNGIR